MSSTTERHPAGDDNLRHTLARIHRHWMAEVRRHIGPVTEPGAGFRERWAALLYLTDRFEHAYGLECEILDDLRGRLTSNAAGRLAAEGQAIDNLRAALEWLERERGTALRVAVTARSLLLALRSWWREIEQAVSGLRSGELSPESRDLLRELHAALTHEAAHALPVSGRLTSVETNRPQARS